MSGDDDISGYPAFVGALLVAIVPPVILLGACGGSLRVFLVGAASWAAAVSVKFPLSKLLRRVIQPYGNPASATALGILSSTTELGIAAACLVALLPALSIVDILAFGVGASTSEIIYIFIDGIRRHRRQPNLARIAAWRAAARNSACVRCIVFVERLDAFLLHVGSRSLVYLGLVGSPRFLLAIAFSAFAVVDGLAVYGKASDWNWFEPAVCRRFFLFVLAISLSEIGLFAEFGAGKWP